MGFDVTYHPVTPEEMHSLYFTVREQSGAEDTLIRDYQLNELYGDKLQQLFTPASVKVVVVSPILRCQFFVSLRVEIDRADRRPITRLA
jgi:hypothetical protein